MTFFDENMWCWCLEMKVAVLEQGSMLEGTEDERFK